MMFSRRTSRGWHRPEHADRHRADGEGQCHWARPEADLEVDYPERLTKWAGLVKWWLPALPQILLCWAMEPLRHGLKATVHPAMVSVNRTQLREPGSLGLGLAGKAAVSRSSLGT
jgi:hypothetical protein